ncbi:hypothetical protein DdX_04525 [Ditylenchus destructor]|uniref:Uncharacterized protein n=1 Tax=Ditylenchus destructor TaxID=166010 RepID=A0AAD4NF23_9BILA|nr:hypothetical protein DdX_04525 [Ditylenchus destructor]
MVKVEFISNDRVVSDDERLANSVMLNFEYKSQFIFRVLPMNCTLSDSFTFAYESKPEPCFMNFEWSSEHIRAFRQGIGNPTEINCRELKKTCAISDITFELLIYDDIVHYGIENSENMNNTNRACPPFFTSTNAFFNVTKEPELCQVFLKFDYDVIPPHPNYFADNNTIEIDWPTDGPTTDLPGSQLSAASFWVLVIAAPILGILFLIGVCALIYGYCVIRKRRQKRRAMEAVDLLEGSMRTWEEDYSTVDRKKVNETTDITLQPPPFQVKKLIEEDKKLQSDEREALVAVIKRLRNPKPYNWELKLNNGEQLDEGDLREKEITEAEWRWIRRRNFAFMTHEDHRPDPLLDEKLRELQEKKQFKEMRKLQTFLSRPVLYQRLLDEEKMARKRHWQRTTGKPLCTESEMGVRIAPDERHISRPEPEPMNQDWSSNIKRMRQSKTATEMAESNKRTQPNSSGKETTAQTSEHTDGEQSAPVA